MKNFFKFLFGAIIVGAFILSLFDDNKESSSESSNAILQTEQKQESEAQRQARKAKEEAERKAREKEEKKKELLEYARDWANTFSSTQEDYKHPENRRYRDEMCKTRFMDKCPNPTDEELKLYKEFKRVWDEEWEKVQNAKRQMDNM